MKNNKLTLLLLAGSLSVVTPLLQGCFPIAAVGVTAGALAIADRRSIATQAVDDEIEIKGEAKLLDRFRDRAHINITSYNRKVLVSGEATSTAIKNEALQIIRSLPNVDSLIDEVQVASTATLSSRSNDSFVTTKVKARFVEAGKFGANFVKVVTEAGNVYLMGIVTEQESRDAIELARTTSGVRKVITLMEIVSPEQAKALEKPAASAPATPAPVEGR